MAGRRYPTSEVRGGGLEDLPHVQGQGKRLGGETPLPRRGGCAGCRRAERSYSMFNVRRDGNEEIPLAQSKEQWLHFAGTAKKR